MCLSVAQLCRDPSTHTDHGNEDEDDDNIEDIHNYNHSTYSQTICCNTPDDVLSFTQPSFVWNNDTSMEDYMMT